MKLTLRPLTPDLWSAFEDLFGDSRVCSRCWCMYWRIGAAYRQRPGQDEQSGFSGDSEAWSSSGTTCP